jgi:hypothetical protein
VNGWRTTGDAVSKVLFAPRAYRKVRQTPMRHGGVMAEENFPLVCSRHRCDKFPATEIAHASLTHL